MTEKMLCELPAKIPNERLRKLRTEYLASIAQDWKTVNAILSETPQIKPAWDPRKKIVDQILSFPYQSYRSLARIFQMQMQEKTDAGDISGALADFERSSILLKLDSLLAVWFATGIEDSRLDGLSYILSRGKLSPEQLEKLEFSTTKTEFGTNSIAPPLLYLESELINLMFFSVTSVAFMKNISE